jgi:hypothetical protein
MSAFDDMVVLMRHLEPSRVIELLNAAYGVQELDAIAKGLRDFVEFCKTRDGYRPPDASLH